MRVTYTEIGGTKYPLCLSLTACQKLSEHFGGICNIFDCEGHEEHEILANSIYVIACLMEAGSRYVNHTMGEHSVPPDISYLSDIYGLDDIAGIKSTAILAISGGITSEI